jgi:hypothetical protein
VSYTPSDEDVERVYVEAHEELNPFDPYAATDAHADFAAWKSAHDTEMVRATIEAIGIRGRKGCDVWDRWRKSDAEKRAAYLARHFGLTDRRAKTTARALAILLGMEVGA